MQTVSHPQASQPTELKTYMLDISGMKCAGCSQAVERQLLQQGATVAAVNLVTATAMVQCPPETNPEQLAARLTEIGFPTALRGTEAQTQTQSSVTPAERQQQETQRQIQQVTIAAALLLFSTIGHLNQVGWIAVPGLSNIWLHWGLATLALLVPGRSILVSGWRGLRHNIPNMDSLVGLGTVTAYTTSLVALLFPQLGWECFFDEPVMLIGFILLGRALEQQARSRATQSLQALIALQPSLARLVSSTDPDAAALEIPASQVRVGEWLQVLPGEKIPVDGTLVAGQTTVNEAMLTGEAMPVLKQMGDSVTGGSLNLSGMATIQATRTGQDTTLAQIIELVESAQTRKAPIQGLADRVAGYFTYGVMTLSLLTFLFWYFVGLPLWSETIFAHLPSALGNHMSHVGQMGQMGQMALNMAPSPLLLSLKLAIAVLVIACPCALGLATSTAILVGSSLGAERGLLIRGGDVLEKMHELDLVAFDKTGTLTAGDPSLTDCISLDPAWSEAALLQVAATVESGTQHPLARAIQQAAAGQSLLLATEFHTEPGLGIAAVVDGDSVLAGTEAWLEPSIPVSTEAISMAQAFARAGKTPIYLGIAGRLVGLMAVQDQLRPEAMATIQQLRQMGLQLRMLTGDQPAVAATVAAAVGLSASEVIADLRPDQKATAIRQLQADGMQVAMIGDGINDAPALAQADIGIALTSGTAVAIETAGIILMRDKLGDLVAAIRLSQATFNKIRQNLFWAFIYNALALPLAAGALLPFGILLSPAAAGALMAFSSLSVVTNSLLLRRVQL